MWEADAPATVHACSGFVPPAEADTVGAGDAFLAAFLVSRLDGAPPGVCLEAGCRLGAFVAGAVGATPQHDAAAIAGIEARNAVRCVETFEVALP